MKGYRTLIVAAVQVITGILAMTGVVVSDETVTAMVDNVEILIGAVFAISGIAMGVMRVFTDSRIGDTTPAVPAPKVSVSDFK